MTDLPKFVTPISSSEATKFVVASAGFGFIAAGLLLFPRLILSPEHRVGVEVLLAPAPPLSFVAVAAILAWLLFYLFEVHESVYDRLFVKWRLRHDRDFLLPKLFDPFREQLVPDYLKTIAPSARKYVDRVFCPFITGGFQIPRESVRRFYRALSWYWVTQLFEIFLLTLLATLYAYGLFGRYFGDLSIDHQAKLLAVSAVLVLTALANNLWLVRRMRRTLRDHTESEIEEILFSARPRLESLVLAVANDAGILKPEFAPPVAGWAEIPGRQALPPAKARIYLAAPMRSLPDDRYAEVHALMMTVVDALQRFPAVHSVHYPGAVHERKASTGDTLRNLNAGLRELGRCDVLILYYPHPVASSVLFEAGYALARGKQVLLFVRDHDDLPSILRAARQLHGVREFVCPDEPAVFDMLSDIFGEP